MVKGGARLEASASAGLWACWRRHPKLFSTALLHVNLLLVLYAGAALCTAARLRWDPSTYMALRAALPTEVGVATVLLPAGAAAIVALAHLAHTAHTLAPSRAGAARLLYTIYAMGSAVLILTEAVAACWGYVRVSRWVASDQAALFREALQLTDRLHQLLHSLGRWFSLPKEIDDTITEAKQDAPRNLIVGMCAGAALVLLQLAALLLAVLAARAARPSAARTSPARRTNGGALTCLYTRVSRNNGKLDSEKRPVKAVFENGKLMMV